MQIPVSVAVRESQVALGALFAKKSGDETVFSYTVGRS
jgi:hypothetical protein